MISDPVDISKHCGECYLPPDLLEDDGLGCARGIVNAFLAMGTIYALLFAGAWLLRWLQK